MIFPGFYKGNSASDLNVVIVRPVITPMRAKTLGALPFPKKEGVECLNKAVII